LQIDVDVFLVVAIWCHHRASDEISLLEYSSSIVQCYETSLARTGLRSSHLRVPGFALVGRHHPVTRERDPGPDLTSVSILWFVHQLAFSTPLSAADGAGAGDGLDYDVDWDSDWDSDCERERASEEVVM
jgi:hypothetical protein